MASYVVGDSSPYLKRVLIPFWCLRIFIMAVYIVVYGLAAFAISRYRDDIDREFQNEYGGSVDWGAAIGIIVAILVIAVFCLAVDIACIVKRARRTLSPRFFLIANVVQTTIWLVLFVLMMIGARTGTTVAIGVVIFLSFLGLLIYASVIFHKHRKGTLTAKATYAPASQSDFAPGHAPGIGNTAYDPNTAYGYGQPNAPAFQPDQSSSYGANPEYGYGGGSGAPHKPAGSYEMSGQYR